MASTDIERLAQDLLEDIAERQLTEIVVASDGRPNSLSSLEFDDLRALMAELAPNVKLTYRQSP
jgi:hypothetical protein